MPEGILNIAFGSNEDLAKTFIRRNVGHKNKGVEFVTVNIKPSGLMESLTDTHECNSLSSRDGHQGPVGQKHPYHKIDGPDCL